MFTLYSIFILGITAGLLFLAFQVPSKVFKRTYKDTISTPIDVEKLKKDIKDKLKES